jgi:hypothetical protein
MKTSEFMITSYVLFTLPTHNLRACDSVPDGS